MKFAVIPIILLFITLNTYARDVESLTVARLDGSQINYYLLGQPDKSPSDVLLLILQGSSCNSVLQIESIFSDYQDVWPTADLLLIEKYGIDRKLSYSPDTERKDCPVQYLQNDSPKQRVADINTVIDRVRKDRRYRYLIVLGGSEGALVANLFASSNEDVDATISFNGGGRWFIDDVLYNITSEYENRAAARDSIEGFKGFSEHVLNSQPSLNLVVSGHGYSWWHQMLSIDQFDVLQKVNSPLLIVQAGMDLSVSPQAVDAMIMALRKAGNKNIDYLTYEKLDHGFSNGAGQNERKKVIADMKAWLTRQLNNTEQLDAE
ncbi:alpha/beta hydrolase family protein [Shewanella algidipiscicola]|uniref:alpha/beta hydrolase family protein n=1 Tax=Shewanella algidipiscicola TaxID=614070 RepID=UPI000D787B35|nr:prolyl oligopeptidase family serine peptidase [Shewanella algidipiscicola]